MSPSRAIAPSPEQPDSAPPLPGVAYASDGEPLHYKSYGRGTPLLLEYGLVSSSCHWPYFVDYFRRGYRVVAWDYRGHGGAPPPRDPGTVHIEQFAQDSHAVAAQAAPEGAVVVALSFGVQVALEHYRAHPGDVRALVLICGTCGHPLDRLSTGPALRHGAAAALRGFGRLGPVARLALQIAHTSLPRRVAYLSGGAHRQLCPRATLDELFAHVARLDPRVFGEICASYFEHSAEDMLGEIRVPTLLIAGDQDQLTPVTTAQRMQRQIPDARLVVFPGHSHLVQVERPLAVHEAIAGFLTAIGLGPARG